MRGEAVPSSQWAERVQVVLQPGEMLFIPPHWLHEVGAGSARQRLRHTQRETDRQTDRQTETNRQRQTERDRQRQTQTERIM